MTKIILAVLVALPIALGGASVAVAVAEEPKVAAQSDVIARVGDQAISFHQINTMLNSSAVVGVSVPALGTPERGTARIVVLDKVISANLLYLDAKRQGLDKDPVYQRDMRNFSNGILAGQYHRRFMAGEITVSEEEVQAFFEKTMVPDTEMTDDLHTMIEATLRKRKLHERLTAQREGLRKDLEFDIYTGNLEPAGDEARADDAAVAELGEEVIAWGEVKISLIAAGKGATAMDPTAMEADARLAALQTEIDKRIMAQKAREAGLDKDPLYRTRFNEFQKTRLVNMHRANLAREKEPSEEQLKAYYEANRMDIMKVEMRKIQDVVVKTCEEAEALKAKMELRKNDFTVEVYEDNMVRLSQQEADMVARLTEQAAKPGSKTEQRVEELKKLIGE